MRKFLIFFIFLFLTLPSNAEMFLEGGVKYNVESAREVVDENVIYKIPLWQIKSDFIDKNHKENIFNLLKGSVELKDRSLALFSDGTYGVIYKKNELEVFYYKSDGILLYKEIRDGLKYPFRAYKYDTKGNLVNKSLRVSKGETFIYAPSGELIAHWVKNFGYDAKGNIIMERVFIE